MHVVNYSDFRKHLAQNLNVTNDNKEVVIVSRPKGKSVAVLDIDEYNSIMETLHLLSNEANRSRQIEAITEMKSGISFSHNLIEE